MEYHPVVSLEALRRLQAPNVYTKVPFRTQQKLCTLWQTNIAGWNIPIFNRKYIYVYINTYIWREISSKGPFSLRPVSLPECICISSGNFHKWSMANTIGYIDNMASGYNCQTMASVCEGKLGEEMCDTSKTLAKLS